MKGMVMAAVAAVACAAGAERLTVHPPARTIEEKVALAERTLEYVAKSVPAEKLKSLKDELDFDRKWCAKAASPGEKYAAERAVMSVRRRILFMHPDLQFPSILAVQRGLPFSEEAGMTDQYAGRWSRPGPGLVVIDGWKSEPRKRVLLAGRLPRGCTINPCLHWDADRVIFAFNDHERKPPVDPRKVHAPGVMNVDTNGRKRPPIADEIRAFDPENPNMNPSGDADEFSAMHHRYFIYEAAVDGSWVRQLTGRPGDPLTTPGGLCTVLLEDADPCYLPGGGFVFTSTRAQNYGRCHWGRYVPSFLLYRADLPPDGDMRSAASNIRQFSFAEANEWRPDILSDGRIVYTRWDYVDRNAAFYAGLWVTRQDGTAVDIVYGNYSATMRSCTAAHQVPGTRYIVGVAGAHHMFSTGTLVLIDPLAGQDGEGPLTRLTPDTGIPECEGWFQQGAYMDPMPVNDTLFFASYSAESFGVPPGHPRYTSSSTRSHWQNPRSYGVWLVDRLGGREPIYLDPEWSTFNPTPIVKRRKPPVVASTLPPPEKAPAYGTLYLQNVYDCRFPIPSNSVSAIRINRMVNMNACRRESWAPGPDYAYYRETLGTVPVGRDGSAYFRIPAETPIQLQALDMNGMAVMTMRSEIYAQKGEVLGCAGCHESKMSVAPVTKRPAGREPDVPVKEVDLGYSGPISYVRSIQPIFDRHCISCHGLGEYKGPKNPYSLVGTNGILNLLFEKWEFKDGYLHKYVRRDGEKKQIATAWNYKETIESKPYDYYAAASPLLQRVKRGHGGARLSDEELKTMILWLDSNVPGFSIGGGYGWNRPELNAIDPEGEKALRAAIAQRWGLERASEPIEALVNRAEPAKSRVLLAALPESAGGWGQWETPFEGRDDPQYRRFLKLAEGAVVPSRWHDIRGTCGRDDKCECNSCWLRLGGFNDPKAIYGK
ncbi:MAG: hypothetical protein IKO72_08190 [Kiritimatiellae bacterium]|nr:hypothetical protein [Kiritimatiellia bacterium]